MDYKFIAIAITLAWLVINLLIGTSFAGAHVAKGKCNTDFNRRIEYIFPGHVLGCWLYEDIKK